MFKLRLAGDRGHFDFGWLNTYHSFSFGEYHDPAHIHFRALRVLNEDRVAPGQGFPPHPHRDMEILTWVLEGSLQHQDDTGAQGVIRPGDLQIMTAGRGIHHSEFNASRREPVHLLQIWLLPSQKSLAPAYQHKHFPLEQQHNQLCLLACPAGSGDSLPLHAEALVYVTTLDQNVSLPLTMAASRHLYIHLARGRLQVADTVLHPGDALAVSEETSIKLLSLAPDTHALIFDLA